MYGVALNRESFDITAAFSDPEKPATVKLMTASLAKSCFKPRLVRQRIFQHEMSLDKGLDVADLLFYYLQRYTVKGTVVLTKPCA